MGPGLALARLSSWRGGWREGNRGGKQNLGSDDQGEVRFERWAVQGRLDLDIRVAWRQKKTQKQHGLINMVLIIV